MDERVLKILGYDKIQQMLVECAVSSRGAAAAKALLPATDRREVETMIAQTRRKPSVFPAWRIR